MVSRVKVGRKRAKRESAFTTHWNDCRENIKKLALQYRRLRSKLANKYKEIPPQPRKSRRELFDEVVELLKGSSLRAEVFRICSSQIGAIEGIKVGDKFRSRGEVIIVGLHMACYKRIVTETSVECVRVAVSIVDSVQYDYVAGKGVSSFEFTNTGQGRMREKKDRALRNSMIFNYNVRVVRKVKGIGKVNDLGYKFFYAGLHRVTKCWTEIDAKSGKQVYRFKLVMVDEGKQYKSAWMNQDNRICGS